STPLPVTPPPDASSGPGAPPPADAVSLSALPGWAEEDHLAALTAYAAGCAPSRSSVQTCQQARDLMRRRPTPSDARAYLEQHFLASEVRTDDGAAAGLLTAYFAPEYQARR